MNIKTIQSTLKQQNLSGYFIPLGNMFINEDILDDENQIRELTDFTGSYALLYISQTKSYLFVDGRYELQAQKEVNLRQTEIIKLSEITLIEWLKKNLSKKQSRICYNPWTISIQTLLDMQKKLPNIEFVEDPTPNKLLSSKKAKTFPHQKKFTGLTTKTKIADFTTYLKEKKLDAFLITSAANSSWLLNMRSNALPYSPLFRAFVLVEKNGTHKVFAENTDYKAALPFSDLAKHLAKYKTIGVDYCTTPAIIKSLSPEALNIADKINHLKAVKNETELKNIKNAHIKDGVALTKFLYWLSKNYKDKTEIDIAKKLLEFRKKELNFYSESFATIAGFGANGAIVHYHATPNNTTTLKKDSILLLDSGGQYYDGTTDVTRTIALGTPIREMIEKNTLVLKAHIALATAVFLKDTRGNELDLIARQPLLKQSLDYSHGTGHGVGFFSDVHEGPTRISITAKKGAPLTAGMVTSIEPGYYKENAFGIRIENLYFVKPFKKTKFLTFEVLTLAPLDKNLIDKYMLTDTELSWLNTYHRYILKSLKKYMTKQELEWLKEACAPL